MSDATHKITATVLDRMGPMPLCSQSHVGRGGERHELRQFSPRTDAAARRYLAKFIAKRRSHTFAYDVTTATVEDI
jgi:hypothetical protein